MDFDDKRQFFTVQNVSTGYEMRMSIHRQARGQWYWELIAVDSCYRDVEESGPYSNEQKVRDAAYEFARDAEYVGILGWCLLGDY